MERFIFTFGQNHVHEVDDIVLDKDCVAVIEAENHSVAREIAWVLFGPKFRTSYSEEAFDNGNCIKYFPRGKVELN